MISNSNQRLTRRPWKFTFAANEIRTLDPVSDYYYVYSILDAGSVDREVELSVNDGDFAPVAAGHTNSGPEGLGELKKLQFKNTSGVSVTVVVIWGNGKADFLGAIRIQGGTLDLSSATIDALVGPESGTELKANIVQVVNGAPQAFSDCKSIEVLASGAAVTLTSPSGLNWAIPAGTGKKFSCEDDINWLETITVTCAVGATAEVSTVYY